MIQIIIESKDVVRVLEDTNGAAFKNAFCEFEDIKSENVYFLQNGKLINENTTVNKNIPIHVVPRLLGGKGGFGSMLRAIGAQIEKTTNREACRDLSGRRLRDINEEKRLKTWIAQQVEREKDAASRKQKKLERMCEPPKHEFKDEAYDEERSQLTEKVEDALMQGLKAKATTSQVGVKRKRLIKDGPRKKAHLWLDDEDDDGTSSDDSDAEPCSSSAKTEKESVDLEQSTTLIDKKSVEENEDSTSSSSSTSK